MADQWASSEATRSPADGGGDVGQRGRGDHVGGRGNQLLGQHHAVALRVEF
jgi:hypothetical protein